MRRIDELFEIERTINGKTPEQRLAARREKSKPLVIELEIWMRQQRALLSSGNDTAKAINYLLNRWAAFTRFLDDGRVCLTNNAAERASTWCGGRKKKLDLRRFRCWRPSRRRRLYPRRDLQDERRRSASLAR